MKNLTLTDNVYSALEAAADSSGRAVEELATEAIEAWLAELELDELDHAEIEAARAEALEDGGTEFEEFFDDLLEKPD